MTIAEWMLKKYGIKITKTQMILPTDYIEYKKYCSENGVKEDWHN